ncbi:hypothetical protein A2U01_0008450 [Trifolium medium]|uniref:Retrotransposon gag domain-containing protein n=1 Tax=Trifolium medium TaxID=97028 RepID=A0A392MJC6_9FABA|nr:hypothetical protein [Trifolium medium]
MDEKPLSSDEDGEDVQILTECQLEKRPKMTPEKMVGRAQPPAPLTREDITDLLATLRSTNETLQQQGLRISALEESIRSKRSGSRSPRRISPRSKTTPPRRQDTHNRRPALEWLQQPNKKRDRTPPRQDRGASLSRNHGNHEHRIPTPPHHDNSPPQYSPEGSDEEPYRCSLSGDFMRAHIPSGFEKPPPLGTYDGQTDPDDHFDNINAILDFRRVSGAIRCRLFPTTLRKGAMAWYQSLAPESVSSLRDLTDQFCRNFIAFRRHPKTVVTLEAIYQGPDESLRNYIKRFNKEAVQVNTTDNMKKYLLERGLRPRSDFAKAVGIEKPHTLDELLTKAQPYIQYEEREAANSIRHSRSEDNPSRQESNPPPRESSRGEGGKKKNDKPREPRGQPSMFSSYTPLISSREHILSECAASEFRQGGIRFPK